MSINTLHKVDDDGDDDDDDNNNNNNSSIMWYIIEASLVRTNNCWELNFGSHVTFMLLFLCVVALFPPFPSQRILTDVTVAQHSLMTSSTKQWRSWCFLTSGNDSLLDYQELFQPYIEQITSWSTSIFFSLTFLWVEGGKIRKTNVFIQHTKQIKLC